MHGFGYVTHGCISTCKKCKALNPNQKIAAYLKVPWNKHQTARQLAEKEWEYGLLVAQCYIPPLQSKMSSSEFLPLAMVWLWAQDIPCLCYHPCPAHMSHLPPSCLPYITDAFSSPPCINVFLLLIGTLEVAACGSNTDGTGFTGGVGGTTLPLAQMPALPSLQGGWAQYKLLPHAGQLTCPRIWPERAEGRSMPTWKVLGWACPQATPTPTKPRQMAGILSFQSETTSFSAFLSLFLFSGRKQT